MLKLIIIFSLVTLFFAGVIHLAQKFTKREIWKLTKLLGFSILCALLTIISLTTVVILF